MTPSFSIAVDTGGTFTDCIAIDPNGQILTCKVLSNSSLRGSITEWIDAQTFKIDHSWQIKRDILSGYEFQIMNLPPLSKNAFFNVKFYDAQKKIIRLNQELPIELKDKKLSFSITAHEEAPILAARIITQTALNEAFPPLNFRLGTTKGTNALLERKGAKTAFLTTEGFGDILTIGTQQRPDLFALNIIKPKPLSTEGVEISERLDANGSIFKALTINNLNNKISHLKALNIESIAVALMHSYLNPQHELILKKELEKHFKYVSISSDMSGQIKFVPRAQTTVVNAYLQPILDNYLTKIKEKLPPNSLRIMTSAGSLIQNDVKKDIKGDIGDIIRNEKGNYFQPKDSLLSGPAGGIVGAAAIGKQANHRQLITFDMGGTSTDVARFDGDFEYKFSVEIGGATVFSPALAIETVAAGGGSICRFDGQKLVVGPESAGAFPGPACYGAGGDLTVTDVNLLLGRLDTSAFGIPVFPEAAAAKLADLQKQIIEKTRDNIEKEAILNGFLAIANEKMADAIRKISVSKGYAPPQYALLSFGGAGGLHACSLARLLNMTTILMPKHAGLLSAYGILNASIERFAERQILKTTDVISLNDMQQLFQELEKEATEKVISEGVLIDNISIKKRLVFCRLKGQDAALDIDFNDDFSHVFEQKYRQVFGHWIENRLIEIESIRVIATELKHDNLIKEINAENSKSTIKNNQFPPLQYKPEFRHKIKAFFDNQWQNAPVYFREDLNAGATINGFALLLDNYATTVIEKDFTLIIDAHETAILTFNASKENRKNEKNQSETIDLELFTNRFTAIADNMGALLQRTSLSVNVKERLDFSCALLDAQGELIANAPHIPVHLGSLGVCVRRVAAHLTLEEGDVVVTNHPAFGGSHLPDVTLISPVFVQNTEGSNFEIIDIKKINKKEINELNQSINSELINSNSINLKSVNSTLINPKKRLIGYVANRCHHSEIGGIRPASMPPNATELIEEGVIIEPTFLVKKGVVDWETISYKLQNAHYPTRALAENLADLNAALAANLNGVTALQSLVKEHGLKRVHFYMQRLKDYSAEKLALALSRRFIKKTFSATEKMDDGTVLKVKISIKNELKSTIKGIKKELINSKKETNNNLINQKIIFDFTGSSTVHKGNLNATPAIVNSVVIYVLRLLITENIPLNEGFMKNVELIIPKNSILNPDFTWDGMLFRRRQNGITFRPTTNPAVVGGNVETSQRLTDTILKAFKLIACGQGTMNNVLFGNKNFGYYETICGGAGAGDGFHGADAVHTHMTNTRITDPEILEFRYPVRLDAFKIKQNTGGKGLFHGGNGIIRQLTFLEPIELSVLSQHRKLAPFGMNGGKKGQRGKQYLILKNGNTVALKHIDGAELLAGDSFIIETPSGGGFSK
jgi:5-oxoprolinase (ATP-hydrolysing)